MEDLQATVDMGEPTDEGSATLAAEVSERPAPDSAPLPGVAAAATTIELDWFTAHEVPFGD